MKKAIKGKKLEKSNEKEIVVRQVGRCNVKKLVSFVYKVI